MKRQLYLTGGIASVTLGIVGIFLPLLPTVPFMILAAFCFARSNPEFERRLTEDPRFGPHIAAWRRNGAISRKGKIAATIGFGFSSVIGLIALDMPWALLPALVAVTCGTWVWRRPDI